jgi:hypothetical protein
MSNGIEVLLLILAIFGGLDLASRVIKLLVSISPTLLSAQTKLWRYTADGARVAVFRRMAIAATIEEILNQTAFQLEGYLPKGWVRRAKIKWVRAGGRAFCRAVVLCFG